VATDQVAPAPVAKFRRLFRDAHARFTSTARSSSCVPRD
jgi:hypothetical protein